MSYKSNPRQLVLRRDTATGLTLVGWDAELPLGRFEHLELICEADQTILPDSDSEYFSTYQSALSQARHANALMLQAQVQQNTSRGWLLVPFELAQRQVATAADHIGSYANAAMQLHYHLTQNRKQVWVLIRQEEIIHVRARYPQKELDELTYQVWYHRQLHELKEIGGTLVEGNLNICESGLWFSADENINI